MPQFEFQIKTKTEEESERFMQTIEEKDVDIEAWLYEENAPYEQNKCGAFGINCDISPETRAKISRVSSL